MAGITEYKDIIESKWFDQYISYYTAEMSPLIQSGIVQRSSDYDERASKRERMVRMPMFDDLYGDAEPVLEGVDLEPNKIESLEDTAVILSFAKMFTNTDLASIWSGKDVGQEIINKFAGFWARYRNRQLYKMLNGVFASGTMDDNKLDESGNALTAEMMHDALQLAKDYQDNLAVIVMDSATKTYFRKKNLIDVRLQSDSTDFDRYQNKAILIDETLAPASGTDHTLYIMGTGAIALGEGNPTGHVAAEVDRDKKKGSGVDYVINRKTYIYHPRGVAWTDANRVNPETPLDSELEDGANWKRVFQPVQIPIIQVKYSLA